MKKTSIGFGLLIFFAQVTFGQVPLEGIGTNSSAQNEAGRLRSALLFQKVVELIREDYLDSAKTDYDQMTYAALRGLLSSLDPHSQFLDPDSYKMIRTETEGQFGGLGISVGMLDRQLTVNVPIEGGPAFRAGILPGDRIVKINGRSTQKLNLGEAIRQLRGRPGVPVSLSIYRSENGKSMDLSIVREIIQVPTIQDVGLVSGADSHGEKIGYLRINQFGEKTAAEFDAAVAQIEKLGATALIMDLRDNPGGLVEAAVDLVSRFVPPRTLVVATEGRKKGTGGEYFSKDTPTRVKWPVVVLVNGNTASAAEIVAGALQDLRKAVIVGETTFGKGSVQTVQRVDPGEVPDVGVRLTTAHYTTPSRRKIHGVGIEPDVVARLTRGEEKLIYQKRSPGLTTVPASGVEIQDEPLDRAVDILRGWKVANRRAVATR